jgi:hypothetical protein
MKHFGSPRPTARPQDGGWDLRGSQHAFAYGSRSIARGRAGASLDYGAAQAVVERKTLYSMLGFKF